MEETAFDVCFLGKTYPGLYIKNAAKAAQIVARLMEKDVLFSCDTETQAFPTYRHRPKAALSPHLSTVRLFQVFDGENSIIFDMKYIENFMIFTKFLETKRFICHNSVFDLQYFMKYFFVQKMNIGCTLLLAKLINHARLPHDIAVGLKPLAANILKTDVLKEVQASDWSEPDLTFEQIEYAALDAIIVSKLAEKMAPSLVKYGLERVYKLNKDAQHAVAHIQLSGIGIDVERHLRNIDRWREDLFVAKKEVKSVTGLDKITGHTIGDWLETNLDKETLLLWPRTETGKLQTDAHVFADFSYLPIVEPFSKFQKLEKLTSAFGTKLLGHINPETGRIHASYRLCGARTGRMSCTEPNLQQSPNSEEFRSVFIPKDDHVFVCGDFDQIELRVMGELSQDAVMLNAYRNGIDLHSLTASRILKKQINFITKEDRKRAKAFNFGLAFGLGENGFGHYAKKLYGLDISPNDISESIKIYRELYAGYRAYQLKQANDAKDSLVCTTPCGKLRRLEKDKTYGTAMNNGVQGGAAEVMLHALNHLYRRRKPGWKIVNVVHDEIMLEVHAADSFDAQAVLDTAMEDGYLDVFPQGITHNIASIHDGDSWADAKG